MKRKILAGAAALVAVIGLIIFFLGPGSGREKTLGLGKHSQSTEDATLGRLVPCDITDTREHSQPPEAAIDADIPDVLVYKPVR